MAPVITPVLYSFELCRPLEIPRPRSGDPPRQPDHDFRLAGSTRLQVLSDQHAASAAPCLGNPWVGGTRTRAPGRPAIRLASGPCISPSLMLTHPGTFPGSSLHTVGIGVRRERLWVGLVPSCW